ncbi:hypothetical protein ACNKHK_17485 [Shigella flexneri]
MSSSLVTMTNDSRQREAGSATESRWMSSPVKVFGGCKTPVTQHKDQMPNRFLNHFCYRNFNAGKRRR